MDGLGGLNYDKDSPCSSSGNISKHNSHTSENIQKVTNNQQDKNALKNVPESKEYSVKEQNRIARLSPSIQNKSMHKSKEDRALTQQEDSPKLNSDSLSKISNFTDKIDALLLDGEDTLDDTSYEDFMNLSD